jgi:hypothetical protein
MPLCICKEEFFFHHNALQHTVISPFLLPPPSLLSPAECLSASARKSCFSIVTRYSIQLTIPSCRHPQASSHLSNARPHLAGRVPRQQHPGQEPCPPPDEHGRGTPDHCLQGAHSQLWRHCLHQHLWGRAARRRHAGRQAPL